MSIEVWVEGLDLVDYNFFLKYSDEHEMILSRYGEVHYNDMKRWLINNKDFVQEFYKAMEGK